MNKITLVCLISLLCLLINPVYADDPVRHSVIPDIPPTVSISGGPYTYTYTFTNNLPKRFKLPFVVTASEYSTSEFSFDNRCTGKKLFPQESCHFVVTLTPLSRGKKQLMITYKGYDHNVVNLLFTTTVTDDSDALIIGSVTTFLPSTMTPGEQAPYAFRFTNIGSATATTVHAISTVPGFASSCGTQLQPTHHCDVSGTFTAASAPQYPSDQGVTGTFYFAEGSPVSETTLTTVSPPTSGIVGVVTEGLPAHTYVNTNYTVIFTFTNYEPGPVTFTQSLSVPHTSPGPNNCGTSLGLGGSCSMQFTFNSNVTGSFTLTAQLLGTGGSPNSNTVSTSTTVQNDVITSMIGVDYNPNHYAVGVPTTYNSFNDQDVFYTAGNPGKTNVYAELLQLQSVGFTTVRSYQVSPYSWIDIINQANTLGMKVVYEAAIPYNGSNSDIEAAQADLQSVITTVGASTFQNIVSLVFAGHENYDNTNVNYLIAAVQALQATLSTNGISSVPVGSALLSEDLVSSDPNIISDLTQLFNSYTATAPLAFDAYPFQWGVTPPDDAAWINPLTTTQLPESLAWNYIQVIGSTNPPASPTATAQSFYTAGRTLLTAETGWATFATYYPSGYACNSGSSYPPCAPGVGNAGEYLTAVYNGFAPTNLTTYPNGILTFEAYDEPAKDPVHTGSAENFYGVFNSNCVQKAANLVPNNTTSPDAGCQGYTNGALLHIAGGSNTAQPSFTVVISNPSMTVVVPTANRSLEAVTPWPSYLIYNGATIQMTGSGTGNVCTTTATVSSGAITFAPTTCTITNVVTCCPGNVGCSVVTPPQETCFLPANF